MNTSLPAQDAAKPPRSPLEAQRLEALRRYDILDTPPEREFDDITCLAAQICAAPIVLVSLVDASRQWFKSRVGMEACQTGRDISFCAHALYQDGLFIIPDALQDARFAGNSLVTGDPFVRFYAGAPLLTEDGLALGTLCVLDTVPRALSEPQKEALLALSRMVVSLLELRLKTIEQARMMAEREEAQRVARDGKARKEAMLAAALDCIITINEREEVLDWNAAAEATFGYALGEAQGQELSALIIPPALREAHRCGMAHFLATGEGPVLNQRIEVPAIRRDGRELPVELTVVPIRLEGQHLFMAAVRDITERKASEDQLRQAHADLQQANETLEGRVRERTHSLKQAYDATIEGWSRALDLRDKETEGHCRRVTEVTLRLAERVGVGEADLVQIRRGALLHDIGKMGIPDQILLKPGPLSDAEWTVMRQHPTYAYNMLCPIDFLHGALDIPQCHHEKWDGTGYPQGLAGDQIPLAARLFAVADVWDALRSNRPYRAGWPEERVLDHLRSLSGTHFDPQAVSAFLEMMAQGREQREAVDGDERKEEPLQKAA